MIRVNLQEIAPTGGYDSVVEMPAVPRIGDNVDIGGGIVSGSVRTVIWTPFCEDYHVQVRFR